MNAADLEEASSYLICLAYALPRILAIFLVLPMFNRQVLPGILRNGVAGALAVFLVPILMDPMSATERSAGIVIAILVKEALLGFTLGFIIALPIWAFETMGSFIDNQRGASVADTINPLTEHDSSPLGDLFSQAAMVFLFASGGFMLALAAIYDSYLLWPVFDWWPQFNSTTPAFLLGQLDRLMYLAVLLGAPVIFAMFLAEMGLAIISRFTPQLQVFFLAMPIKSGLAMFVFAIYTVTLFEYAAQIMGNVGNEALTGLKSIFIK